MKTEFESRIEFHAIKLGGKKCFEATVYWGNQLYETIKYTKELCISDLKSKAKITDLKRKNAGATKPLQRGIYSPTV